MQIEQFSIKRATRRFKGGYAMQDPRLTYRMLAEAHYVVLTAWKAATNVAKKAALESKKALLERLILNIKW
jgi:hypothetical protein